MLNFQNDTVMNTQYPVQSSLLVKGIDHKISNVELFTSGGPAITKLSNFFNSFLLTILWVDLHIQFIKAPSGLYSIIVRIEELEQVVVGLD